MTYSSDDPCCVEWTGAGLGQKQGDQGSLLVSSVTLPLCVSLAGPSCLYLAQHDSGYFCEGAFG